MYSSEYWETFKNTHFEEHLRTAVSEVTFLMRYTLRIQDMIKAIQFSASISIDKGAPLVNIWGLKSIYL